MPYPFAARPPDYDPDDGPIRPSAAYRAEVRAFLLGEPVPLVPAPRPALHPESPPDAPAAIRPPAIPTYVVMPRNPPVECTFATIVYENNLPDVFDPGDALSGIVYRALDFADCPQIDYAQPGWVDVAVVLPIGVHTSRCVPIARLPPEHIALIDAARAAWDAEHPTETSPSPRVERGLGGEVLPVERGLGGEVLPVENGLGGEVNPLFNFPDSFLSDLAPYLSALLAAHPHLVEALAQRRAARSERARRAAATRRANPRLIPHPVGTPFLTSASPASAPDTPTIPSAILPAVFDCEIPAQGTSVVGVMACLTRLSACLTRVWTPLPPACGGRGTSGVTFRGSDFGRGMRDLARPPPRPMTVLAVPPGVFAFGTPSQLNSLV